MKQFCPKSHDTFVTGRSKDKHCRQCKNDYHGKYYKNNKKVLLEYNKNYYNANKEAILLLIHVYQSKKYRDEIEFRIVKNLRNRLRIAVKNNQKVGSAVRDLGCSITEFKQYIESKFYDNMSWDNYGSIWELDHIRELHTFDLSAREQLLIAVHYTNLQPLTIEDHRKKTNLSTRK